jgi:RNA polymerase sigma factor (sigma-70 family)
MDAQSDAQLLRAYAERRSDAAFAELVRRHIDLVHSAARRMVGDAHLAEDVTQATFLALAKSAAPLTERAVLAGWLHRTAQNIAAQTVRTDVRRRVREQEAAAMNELLAASPDADWEQIAPHLDAALGELTEPERDAVMLRYFQRQTARDMAQTLGISDEAAQKRVSRAVDRLREFLTKRGVTVGASGLAVVISANAVQAAPVGLALTITTAATLAGTTLATTATVTATKAIAMTALQKTVVTATIAVLAGVGIYQFRQAAFLRDQVQMYQQQQAPLTTQLQELQSERDAATNRLAELHAENLRLKSNSREQELLKLRGEIGLLRQQNLELKQPMQVLAVAPNQAHLRHSTNIVAREAWSFAGYATPEAALQSMIWAKSTGDFQTFLNSIIPEATNDVINGYHAEQSPDKAVSRLLTETKNLSGLQILKAVPLDEDTVLVQTTFHAQPPGSDPKQDTLQMVFKNVNGEWKYFNEYVPKH